MSVDMDEVKAAAKLLVTDDEAVDLYNILATTVRRAALLDAERKRLGVERLPQDVLQATLKAFWENVDEQLEEMEAMTIEELRRPIHQRHKLSPQMQALQRALESDE